MSIDATNSNGGWGWPNQVITVPTGQGYQTIVVQSNPGTQASLEMPFTPVPDTRTPEQVERDKADLARKFSVRLRAESKRLGAKLYFTYVKSKLNKNEVTKLRARLGALSKYVQDAEELGQQALYEEFSKKLAVVIREQELCVCGFDRWVLKEHIDKFRELVTEDKKKVLFFKRWEEFPRPVPAKVKTIVKNVQKKALFDELWVLYLDYVKEDIKPNKDRIREKDPILFGRFAYQPDRLYFVTDWVDDRCDLTLDQLVETVKHHLPDGELSKTPKIDDKYFQGLLAEVKERHERLEKTRASNYRDLMAEEDRVKRQKALETLSWFTRFKNRVFKS